ESDEISPSLATGRPVAFDAAIASAGARSPVDRAAASIPSGRREILARNSAATVPIRDGIQNGPPPAAAAVDVTTTTARAPANVRQNVRVPTIVVRAICVATARRAC